MTHDARLLLSGVAAVLLLFILVTRLRQHPFLALCVASLLMGLMGGLGLGPSLASLKAGFGDAAGSVGLVIVFGAMLGFILSQSGATTALARYMLGNGQDSRFAGLRMAVLAGLVGLPLFFESGLALLIPLIFVMASYIRESPPGRHGMNPYLQVGMPALATLSVLHAFTPPHPGATAAATLLGASLSRTMLLGIVLAVPIAAIAGLALPRLVARGVTAVPPQALLKTLTTEAAPRPVGTGLALLMLLLPALLITAQSVAAWAGVPGSALLSAISDPTGALLITILVAIPLLGLRSGRSAADIASGFGDAIASSAPILLVISAGGGFKRVLVDSGMGDAIVRAAPHLPISPLALGWLLAALIRVATGSATVATITAAGIMAPLAAADPHIDRALAVLGIGAGSLFFSHVNDAGFWQVRGYFGLSLADTFRTWSVMETVISLLGLMGVLGLSLLPP